MKWALALVDMPGAIMRWVLDNKGAKVAELADAPDLGSGAARRGGSSPPFRTKSPSKLLKKPVTMSLYHPRNSSRAMKISIVN